MVHQPIDRRALVSVACIQRVDHVIATIRVTGEISNALNCVWRLLMLLLGLRGKRRQLVDRDGGWYSRRRGLWLVWHDLKGKCDYGGLRGSVVAVPCCCCWTATVADRSRRL